MFDGANPYPADWGERSAQIKRFARQKCEHCGKDFLDASGRSLGFLDVHHIDGDKANNSHANLVALCRRCHALIERVFVLGDYFMTIQTPVSPEVQEWFEQIFPWAAKRGYGLSPTNKILLLKASVSPAQKLLAEIFGMPEYELPMLSEEQQRELSAELSALLDSLSYQQSLSLIMRFGLRGGTPTARFWGRRTGSTTKKALRMLRHPLRARKLRRFLVASDTGIVHKGGT